MKNWRPSANRIQSAITANQGELAQKITVIKGNFRGNPYKISKNSKFIQNTERINHKLNQTVANQLRKDAAAHGTYTLNPFAFYPKNIKNTLQTLLGENL